jgi:hypothetical protein
MQERGEWWRYVGDSKWLKPSLRPATATRVHHRHDAISGGVSAKQLEDMVRHISTLLIISIVVTIFSVEK